MSGRGDGQRGDAAGDLLTDPRVSFKEDESAVQAWHENREKAHQRKKSLTDGTVSLQEQTGMEAGKCTYNKNLSFCSSAQHKNLRTNIRCIVFLNTLPRS